MESPSEARCQVRGGAPLLADDPEPHPVTPIITSRSTGSKSRLPMRRLPYPGETMARSSSPLRRKDTECRHEDVEPSSARAAVVGIRAGTIQRSANPAGYGPTTVTAAAVGENV